jgi:hypothetical protein
MLLMVLRSLFVKIGHTNAPLPFTIMRKPLVILVCIATGSTVANPAWAHGGGGGGGSGGAGAAGSGPGGGNGGSGSHGGGEGRGGGMSHGTSFGLSHSNADNTVSNHGTRSVAAGHKGASHHGHALSARSHSSHLTATHHGHHLNYAFEHNRLTRFSTMTRQVTVTPDVDTPAEKALPPGIELNVDRGKAVAAGH